MEMDEYRRTLLTAHGQLNALLSVTEIDSVEMHRAVEETLEMLATSVARAREIVPRVEVVE